MASPHRCGETMVKSLLKQNDVAKLKCSDATEFYFLKMLCFQLGKTRLTIPSRSINCSHLQCFDAPTFIQMNEKKPSWICPICDRPATFKSLIIDGWVLPFIITTIQFMISNSKVQALSDFIKLSQWSPNGQWFL